MLRRFFRGDLEDGASLGFPSPYWDQKPASRVEGVFPEPYFLYLSLGASCSSSFSIDGAVI